jgi:hypothetical protein
MNVVTQINYNVVYTADYSVSVHIFSYISFTGRRELPYFSSGTLSTFVVSIYHLIFLPETEYYLIFLKESSTRSN